MKRDERFLLAARVVRIGFVANLLLMVLKLTVGWLADSKAVVADGIESACDLIAIASTMTALSFGRRPFDHKHPYGHGRAESIAALLVSIVILATAGGVLWTSLTTLMAGVFIVPGKAAVVAAIVTIVAKEGLYRLTARGASLLQSPALTALAEDHRKDAMTSLATLAGVTGAVVGFPVLDPVAALVTSFFIAHIGVATFRSSVDDLMDKVPDEDLFDQVVKLSEEVPGVEHVHEIRGRRSGQFVIIDLKLEMNPQMTVKQSHDIADQVKRLIFERYQNIGDVMIHINPSDEEHEDLIRL